MTLQNAEEYKDPILYDEENDRYKAEVPFLAKWAKEKGGTIIELACGTGRVTIPLAQEGYRMMGVDIHPGMLEQAREKSRGLQCQIEWIEQDCMQLELNTKSKMIFSIGNSFQHFLTNDAQDSLLQSVYHHLEKDGVFIFDTRFPIAEELLQPETEEYWKTYRDEKKNSDVDVFTISKYDAFTQLQHYTTIRKYKEKAGQQTDEIRTNISLRYVYPKEMERLLDSNGFGIKAVFQDWQETPAGPNCHQLVYIAEKKEK